MVGLATGLSLSGKKIFIYSIIPFLVFRCLEQIRNNICNNNLNIKLIGAGGGFSYGVQGVSHNTSEDIAIMRALPNMTVLAPGSKLETELAVDSLFNIKGPVFIRLGKVPDLEFQYIKSYKTIDEGLILNEGRDVALLSTGNILSEVFKSSKILEKKGISTQVISFPCVKPINKVIIKSIFEKFKTVYSIEEHSKIGGFGSAILEVSLEMNCTNVNFNIIALSDKSHSLIGDQDFLRKTNKLDAENIAKTVMKNVKK